ncbi:uncharacterized protein LOC107265441 isoform X2 [Cephus cinctus]|uniref:Uncharacterized protein LOC107265441 isoform X2 n=1 Tax=Cephus cinctus TaxID=211228 RepID=A0AAJ7RDQ9_CEPCN|nr:uncharacterized protein LOC107265441 isoform X2 [Cephus cinctus]
MAEKISPPGELEDSAIASSSVSKDGPTSVKRRESEDAGNRQEKVNRRTADTSSPGDSCKEKRKTRRDKVDTGQLPTPPPDPIPEGNIFEEAFSKHKAHLEAEALQKEGEFLDYLMGLPTPGEGHPVSLSRSASAFAASLGAEDAFDHLDRLYILMEQVLNLREQNAKLSRRVRELERLRALTTAHRDAEKALLSGEDPVIPEEDAGFAESLLGAMLSAGPDVPQRRNFRPPVQRQRSDSVGVDQPVFGSPDSSRIFTHQISRKQRDSLVHGAPKVSKWKKVKAAFKWERAYTGGTGDSDVIRYLRVPENIETCLTSGSSHRTSEMSVPPTPGTLSSSSSTEDVSPGVQKSVSNHSGQLSSRVQNDVRDEDSSRRSRSLDGDLAMSHSSAFNNRFVKDGTSGNRKSDKGCKTPWGKVKDMINLRRESIRRHPVRGSFRSEDGYSISSFESSEILQEAECSRPRIHVTSESPTLSLKPSTPGGEVVDLAARRLTPTLTITVPSREELRSISSPESTSPLFTLLPDSAEDRSTSEEYEISRSISTGTTPVSSSSRYTVTKSKTCQDVPEYKRQRSGRAQSLASSPKMQRHDSKWNKVKKAFLTNTTSVPPSPSKIASFFDEADGLESYNASAENLENDMTNSNIQAEIQRNYQLLHDKLSAEFYRKLTEWEKLKASSHSSNLQPVSPSHDLSPRGLGSSARERDSANLQLLGEEQLTPEFKKKLQEWKRIKKSPHSPISSEQQAGRRRITDWQLWRSTSKPETKSEGEHNKPHLSEDFIKKMEEWKKIKAGRVEDDMDSGTSPGSGTTKLGKSWKTPEDKEFQLLEREWSKIEREYHKFERQKEKLLDREARLSKLRRVVGSSPQKKEVLVHTSTGFYRFEGISRKFTRKLYEWEKSQGISPESSTFRLLNPDYRGPIGVMTVNATHDRVSRLPLTRSKSVGSVVEGSQRDETPIRQPSSLSLNDMEELEAECMAEENAEDIALDDSEPEAMIVDIEDVIEETASPMVELRPHQTPIYCVAASETTSIAVPLGTVTSSHEPSPVILVEAGEVHPMAARATLKGCKEEGLVTLDSITTPDNKEADVVLDVATKKNIHQTVFVSSRSKEDDGGYGDPNGRQEFLTIFKEIENNVEKLGKIRRATVERACMSSKTDETAGRASEVGTGSAEEDFAMERKLKKNNKIVFSSETKMFQKSFECTLEQQKDLCSNLIKKINEAKDMDENRKRSLLRLIKKLESTFTYRYNQCLQDNADAFCTSREKRTPTISDHHRQSAQMLLSSIRDAVTGIYEPGEENFSQGKLEKTESDCSPMKIDAAPARLKEHENEASKLQEKKERPHVSPLSSAIRNVDDWENSETSDANEKMQITGRKSSTEDEDVVITVDKDTRQRKILKTRRLTDTQVGYKWRPVEAEDSSVPADICEEATRVKTTPLTVSAFRETPNVERIRINENTLNKIVVRTANNESCSQETSSAHSSNRNSGNFSDTQESSVKKDKIGARSVFVKTKRMIFSPFRRDSRGKAAGCNSSEVEGDGKSQTGVPVSASNQTANTEQFGAQALMRLHNSRSNSASPSMQDRRKHEVDSKRPPLPQSPILSRKEYRKSSPKETSPSIRMMIQRYNQKLEDAGSPASSGSGSPIWRSPSSERRVRTQMERYQEEVRKAIAGPHKHDVQKSASTSIIREDVRFTSASGSGERTHRTREILKSTSAGFIGTRSLPSTDKRRENYSKMDNKKMDQLLVNRGSNDKISPALIHKLTALSTAVARKEGRCLSRSSSSEQSTLIRRPDSSSIPEDDQPASKLRALRIQRAKEDFLSRGPGCYSHDPRIDRLGDVACGSRAESDLNVATGILRTDLIKSASAGMINVDPDTYERLSLSRGCESLPRSAKRCRESSGRFSQIANKFRRARMRRGKDKESKMSTVSMLCRQSLLVDIQDGGTSKSCPSTPAPQRDDEDYAWLKKHRESG